MIDLEYLENHPKRVGFSKKINKEGVVKAHDYYKGHGYDKIFIYIKNICKTANGKNVDNLYSNLIHKFPKIQYHHKDYFWNILSGEYWGDNNYFIDDERIIHMTTSPSNKKSITIETPNYKEAWYDLTNFRYVSEDEVNHYNSILKTNIKYHEQRKEYDKKYGKGTYNEDIKHHDLYKVHGWYYCLTKIPEYSEDRKERISRFMYYLPLSVSDYAFLKKHYLGFEKHVISGEVYDLLKRTPEYKKLKEVLRVESIKKHKIMCKLRSTAYCVLTFDEVFTKLLDLGINPTNSIISDYKSQYTSNKSKHFKYVRR